MCPSLCFSLFLCLTLCFSLLLWCVCALCLSPFQSVFYSGSLYHCPPVPLLSLPTSGSALAWPRPQPSSCSPCSCINREWLQQQVTHWPASAPGGKEKFSPWPWGPRRCAPQSTAIRGCELCQDRSFGLYLPALWASPLPSSGGLMIW